MIREVVKIDEEKCNGCGVCIPECHEGALQIIDGKARLVSDLMCDGLGACLNHCPQDAMTIEKREAEPYDEIKVIALMVEKGINTVVAHLKHLKDHNETVYLKQAVGWLRENEEKLDFKVEDVTRQVHKPKISVMNSGHVGGGCPGSQARSIERPTAVTTPSANTDAPSELRQWPVQMHLINPMANYFIESDMVLAADCVAFAMGNFHSKYLKGRSVGIACPKLDEGHSVYIDKLVKLIDDAKINTLTVTIMQVPCCGGLLQMAKQAVDLASRKIPLKKVVVSIEGEILSEEWV
ncbi:ATP-binding protein [Carboxylicivirga linearis]|uniref:4Fe-4S binding protein n=1 Tax=Carboxylicivirga linearis TaxID=1628157 RepID=A0ABS5JSK6_9BACT|nr:4Fe-4S binding protein [Carboxylicivirga linearis]MBS2097441.1 4Fe-4S binding protein [Carboxylicivirga linearis]